MPDNKRELTSDEENENNKRQKLDSNDDNPDVGINKLPTEILHKIGGFFDRKDRGNFALTNKRFKDVADTLNLQELTSILLQLGLTDSKDNKPETLSEARKIHKSLKAIQKQSTNFITLFFYHYSDNDRNNMIKLIEDMLDNLYSAKDIAQFEINWAKVFDNAIHVKITNAYPHGYNIENISHNFYKYENNEDSLIKGFLKSLILGNNQLNLSLLDTVTQHFNDNDCKEVMKTLIEKYKSNYISLSINSMEELNQLLNKITNRNLPESIAYIENLIQQQKQLSEEEQLSDEEQFNVNNQP